MRPLPEESVKQKVKQKCFSGGNRFEHASNSLLTCAPVKQTMVLNSFLLAKFKQDTSHKLYTRHILLAGKQNCFVLSTFCAKTAQCIWLREQF